MNTGDCKIRFETLGCRLNQIESEGAARFFVEAGFQVDLTPTTATMPEDESTVLCVVNTCSVTQKAEQKARRIIRLLLRKYRNAAVIVTGCYAQLRPLEIKEIDSRIAVLGGQIKSRLSEVPVILADWIIKTERVIERNECHVERKSALSDSRIGRDISLACRQSAFRAAEFASFIEEKVFSKTIAKPGFPENSFRLATDSFLAHSRSSIKIQDGCNNDCSYCTIHTARGKSVSLDVKSVLERVRELERAGQSEVVFTAVNISQYRGECSGGYLNFAKLLKLCLANTEKINFHISSIYPEIVDDEFCEVISDERVCSHFHISVQSGSDKILKLMNRTYTAKDVIEVCIRLRAAKTKSAPQTACTDSKSHVLQTVCSDSKSPAPQTACTDSKFPAFQTICSDGQPNIFPFFACDIITGFPGETDDDFEQTLELCKKCGFAWIHAFPFSERPGTPAVKMKGKIPQSVSGQRAERLLDLAVTSKIKYIESFVGRELDAVMETKQHAVTKNFIHCEVRCENQGDMEKIKMLAGKLVRLRIKKVLVENIRKGGEVEAEAELQVSE